MSYKKAWIYTFVALLFSLFLVNFSWFVRESKMSQSTSAQDLSTGWNISDGEKILFKNDDFAKAGTLKNQKKIVITKLIPGTNKKSICFATIGYTVEGYMDNKNIYTFASSLNSHEVWGLKVHAFRIPDGENDRELKFIFTTSHPLNIAVSKHVLLANGVDLLSNAAKADLIEAVLPLFYIYIGIFMLICTVISITLKFKKFYISLLILSFITLFTGIALIATTTTVAFFVGPRFVYWAENISNFVVSIGALVFVASDKEFKKSQLLLLTAAVQSIFFCVWLLCNIFNLHLFLLNAQVPMIIVIFVVLMFTFIQEFISHKSRPDIVIAVVSTFIAVFIDEYIYFICGNCYNINHFLNIVAFPVIVLMICKITLTSINREYHIINENMALKLEGELLYKNYQQIEKYIRDTKLIWHDIDKHFSMITHLFKDGEYDELKHYLDHAGYDMKKIKNAYICENKLINAILTDKFSEAQAKGIDVSFKGNLPEKLNIHGNDLCSLLVNMLDNAIEACDKMYSDKEKKINITLGLKNDFIYFAASNSVSSTPMLDGDNFITSKKDSKKHGYGISIMQRIAQKYGGAFDIVHSQNSFMVKVALKNAPVD